MKKIILGFVALPMLALAQYDYVPPFIPDFNVQSTMALSGADDVDRVAGGLAALYPAAG